MLLLSLGLGLVAPLLPGLAAHQEDIAQSMPYLASATADIKTASFISTRSPTVIAGQCALAILGAALLGVRPSADGVKDSRWSKLASRLKMAYCFLVFPEFLIWQAIRQRTGAADLMKTFDPSLNWTKAHAYLIQMGGFVLHDVDFKFQFGRSPTPVKILSYQGMVDLIHRGETKWPTILPGQLAKMSSKRPFVTALALFQTTATLARTAIRGAHGLPISHFELITAFYIVAGWSLAALLWEKPYSIDRVVAVHRTMPESRTSGVPYALPIREQAKQSKIDESPSTQTSSPSHTFDGLRDRKVTDIEKPQFKLRNSHMEKGFMLLLDTLWSLLSDQASMFDNDCLKTIHETEAHYPALEHEEEAEIEKFEAQLALRPNRLYAYQSTENLSKLISNANPIKKDGKSAIVPMVASIGAFSLACIAAGAKFDFPGGTERALWNGSAGLAALSFASCIGAAYNMPTIEQAEDGPSSAKYPIVALSLFAHVISRSAVLVSSASLLQNTAASALTA
ncbi:hypothetical protein BKA70DRAFT_1378324 [Coprinopsis sp. MPI-PUGE-AT-0042]|nr:hypothetical protein BKA70DRAFT_1378324 [Coprinopsis sp. MPI-PUGE-AT-0042]